jgi:hypothetical protein
MSEDESETHSTSGKKLQLARNVRNALRKSISKALPIAKNCWQNSRRILFERCASLIQKDIPRLSDRFDKAVLNLVQQENAVSAGKKTFLDQVNTYYPDEQNPNSPGLALRTYAERMIRDDLGRRRYDLFLALAYSLLGVFILFSVPKALTRWLSWNYMKTLGEHRADYIAQIIPDSLLLCVAWVFSSLFLVSVPVMLLGLPEILIPIYAILSVATGLTPKILILLNLRKQSEIADMAPLYDAMFGLACAALLIALLARVYLSAKEFVRKRSLGELPVLNLLYALFKMLVEIPRTPDKHSLWKFALRRDTFTSGIEEAAVCLELVSGEFKIRNPELTLWITLSFRRRACGIRQLKKWIVLPKADTLQYLEAELRRLLDLVARGDWDGLPVADPEPDLPKPWWRTALNLARTIATMVLPPFVAWALLSRHWMPAELRISADIERFIAPAAIIWVIVSVLFLLDPHFDDKLSMVRKVRDFIAPGAKDKGEKE